MMLMVDSVLKDIQETVIKYSKIIADITQAEVEIVDSNLVRIAGTGIYSDKLNQDISEEGNVYRHVLQTGEPEIIEDHERQELCIPIKLQGEIIGVIGLVCTNLKQNKRLKSNLDAYTLFLGQIEELIGSKVYEKKENERNNRTNMLFGQILDSVDEGVLVINSRSEIIKSNESASKLLRMPLGRYGWIGDRGRGYKRICLRRRGILCRAGREEDGIPRAPHPCIPNGFGI